MLTFVISIGLSLSALADTYCGPEFGPQADLTKMIEVRPQEHEMYEVYLPMKFRGESLSFINALTKGGNGTEGYFQLSFQEKSGKYYLHLGIEPIVSDVTLAAHYGSSECNYQGRVTLKHNKSKHPEL